MGAEGLLAPQPLPQTQAQRLDGCVHGHQLLALRRAKPRGLTQGVMGGQFVGQHLQRQQFAAQARSHPDIGQQDDGQRRQRGAQNDLGERLAARGPRLGHIEHMTWLAQGRAEHAPVGRVRKTAAQAGQQRRLRRLGRSQGHLLGGHHLPDQIDFGRSEVARHLGQRSGLRGGLVQLNRLEQHRQHLGAGLQLVVKLLVQLMLQGQPHRQ